MRITRKLKISKQKFIKLYPTADHEIFFRDPISDEELERRFLTNKLWRLNNLYTIIDKWGEIVPFVMNGAQHKVYAASLTHPRILILKSRQQGISTFWLISYFDDTIFNSHISSGLMSQGRNESGTLLKRVKLAWEHLPNSVKEYAGVRMLKDNADEVGLSNGSTIFIRTSFRSATLQRLHISEYGKICNKYPERAEETKTGTLQAVAVGNTIAIESTAEGINDFKYMWDKAEGRPPEDLGPKEFLAVFLSWLDDPDCVSPIDKALTAKQEEYFAKAEVDLGITIAQEQKNFWVDQYEELGEAIYQEYPMTPAEAFKAIRDGTYYGVLFEKYVTKRNRIVANLYDDNLDVEVAIDLGMNDTFVLGYFQSWNQEYRLVADYRNTGLGILHYVDDMASRGYNITNVYLPWDAEVRELGTGETRLHIFRECAKELELSCTFLVLPKIPVGTGIELVRKIIPKLWLDVECEYTIACCQNYSKEWEDKTQNWKDKPFHNEFSHGADMLRYLAMSRNLNVLTVQESQARKNRQGRRSSRGMAL